MRQVAQFLWIGQLTMMERLCLTSFVKTGYEVHLYTYDILEAPQGVIRLDAAEILPRNEIFTQSHEGFGSGSLTGFSDRFRLHLLSKKGGWWFDTDFISIRKMNEPKDLYFASSWEGEWGQCAINSAMWCKPNDPRMLYLRDKADALVRDHEVRFGEIGPFLLQESIRTSKLEQNVAPWWEFCPYPWRMVDRMAFETNGEWVYDRLRLARHVLRELTQRDFKAAFLRSGTRAVHLHNEVWRSAGLSKDKTYHRGSLVGRLQRKFGIV